MEQLNWKEHLYNIIKEYKPDIDNGIIEEKNINEVILLINDLLTRSDVNPRIRRVIEKYGYVLVKYRDGMKEQGISRHERKVNMNFIKEAMAGLEKLSVLTQ